MMDDTAHSNLVKFDDRLAKVNLRGQWTSELNPRTASDGPQPKGVPCIWRYDEVLAYLNEACETFPDVQHARRNITFDNPALRRYTTHTLAAGLQLIQPGEVAWPHRHTASAMRFVIEGDAELVTVVDGVAWPMENYDFILTPNWSWHGHHNRSSKNTIWLDLLDIPLIFMLNQGFVELGPEGNMETSKDEAAKVAPMRFPWVEMEAKLRALDENGESDPYHGVTCDYVDPRTGGPTMATVACHAHMMRQGETTRRRRRTSSAIYFVIEGEGRTVVGDTELDWAKHDTFCIPNWQWHQHENLSRDGEAFLFSIDDSPMLAAFDFLREDSENG